MDAARGLHYRIPAVALGGLGRAAAPVARLLNRLEAAPARWHRAFIALGLLAPLIVLYRQLLFGNQPWLDFDLLLSYQPRYQILAAGLADGRIPIWSDGLLGGFPIAFSEFGWFYPLTWGLLRLADPLRAYAVELAIGVGLVALAAYWLGRVWGLSRLASFLAAFLVTYGPFVFATSRFLNYADIFFALPAGLGAIELIGRGRRRYAALLALSLSIMGLAGHPQIALLFAFAWLVYALFRLGWAWRDAGTAAALRFASWLLAALAVGIGIAAVRLLPTVFVTGQSARAGGLDFAVASQGSIPPWSLALGYLFPSFEIPRVLNDTLNAEELVYLGLLTPALALLGLIWGRHLRTVRFLAVLALVSWVLAMGSYSLAFPLIHKLPLFSFFRQPARFALVAGFGIAFLAGFGVDLLRREGGGAALATRWVSRIWLWLAAAIAAGTAAATIVLSGFAFLIVPYGYDYIDRVVVGSEGRFLSAERYYLTFDQLYGRMQTAFSLVGWTPRWLLLAAAGSALVLWAFRRGTLSGRHLQWSAAGLIVADVLLAPGHNIPTIEPERLASEPLTQVAVAGSSGAGGRVFSYRGLAQKFELSTATGTRLSRDQRDLLEFLFLRETFEPNLPLTRGMRSIDGYENLMPRTTAEFLSGVGSERTTVAGFASDPGLDAAARQARLARQIPALAAVGVRYVSSGVRLDLPGLSQRFGGDVPLPVWAGVTQPLYVYEVEGWRPAAYVTRVWSMANAAAPLADQIAALPAGTDAVIVDRAPDLPPDTAGAPADVVGAVQNGPETTSVQVRLAAPGLLVINEAMAPGWSATVDGQPNPLLTVNGLMRGLALTAGPHWVEMRYEPRGYRPGVVLSLLGAGALVALFAAGWWADRRRSPRSARAARGAGATPTVAR